MATRGPTLNPTSMPFVPGSGASTPNLEADPPPALLGLGSTAGRASPRSYTLSSVDFQPPSSRSSSIRIRQDSPRVRSGTDQDGGGGGHSVSGSVGGSVLSTSPSDYRSITSTSPSPPPGTGTRVRVASRQMSNPTPPVYGQDILGPLQAVIRGSPSMRQGHADNERLSLINSEMELKSDRALSVTGSVDSFHDMDDNGPETPMVGSGLNGTQVQAQVLATQQLQQAQATREAFASAVLQSSRDRLGTPPAPINRKDSRSSSYTSNTVPYTSASPVSSLESSGFASAAEHHRSSSFEAQLRSSPFMFDVLERLGRCELAQSEIQRQLGDLNGKIGILLERSLSVSSTSTMMPNIISNNGNNNNGMPEFNDPFASSSNNAPPMSLPPGGLPPNALMHRGSIGGGAIAPNQQPPQSDDISQIAQRLNSLTSSVGQLLALQTQQHVQNHGGPVGFPGAPGLAVHNQPMDVAPNQQLPTPNSAMLGLGLPNRPDLRGGARTPNMPMRTWSAGSLDIPGRGPENGGLGRPDAIQNRQRKSVMGITRRDSAGADGLGGGRDNGPTLTRWEQLSLAPELLRSLSKFGVGPPNKIQQRALPFLLRGSDIIAQAPPTQERIAAYVIPAIQVVITNMNSRNANRGPMVVMISTTVDQATQAQRMIRDLGGPIGVRSALGVGLASVGNDLGPELHLLQQNMPHIICGTPQKLHALFTSPGGLPGSEVRFLVLDEVDQLIARNLHEFVFTIARLFPPPRSRALNNASGSTNNGSSLSVNQPFAEPSGAPAAAGTPFQNTGRRLSGFLPPPTEPMNGVNPIIERQTALFSNTVPQDVLNLAQAIHLREPVRVLVRRDGNVTQADTSQGGARGLRQFYLYLAFTATGRSEPMPSAPTGSLGIIGSGRGATSAETAQAREWKLDALVDLFDDLGVPNAIVHVGGMTSLDAVVYKLASKNLDVVSLHSDMNPNARMQALNKFRNPAAAVMRAPATRVLIVYDVQVKTADVSQVPLVVNYDLPKAVEEYAHRVAPAIASSYSRAGVVINFVTATGGDVEMLRSIECFYKIKCPEVPMSLRDIV